MNSIHRTFRTPVAQRGASLVEVMIAVLVFSIGLLGAGIMNSSAMKNTHNAYLRSQASFLADSMAERMRSNPLAVAAGQYSGALNGTSPAMPSCTACLSADVAQRDRAIMGQQIANLLPAGTGTIDCAAVGAVAFPGQGAPPINGSCTITLNWGESRDVDNAGYSGTQSFQLVFQP